MVEHKKQHYVQQSYLERFSKNAKQIHVFDKSLNKAFSNAIGVVAQESQFYRLPEGLNDEEGNPIDVDPLLVEKWFQPIEGNFNRDIKTLVALNVGDVIPAEARDALCLFIPFQYLRTRAARNLIVDSHNEIATRILELAIKHTYGEDYLKYTPKIEYSDKTAALFQIKQILDDKLLLELAEICRGHVWMVLANETEHPFYTSDTPVVLHNHLDRPSFRPGKGFASQGIEIALPLSSTRLLSIIDRQILGDNSRLFDRRVLDMAAENVEFYNSLQVLESERQIYCESADWGLVEDMIEENPKITERQTRVSVK